MAAPPVALIAEGLAHHRAGRLDLAAARFQAALRLDPQAVQAWRMLGLIAQQQGRFADSLEPTRRALALQRTASDLSNLANALSRLGRSDEARDAPPPAAALAPKLAAAPSNPRGGRRAVSGRRDAGAPQRRGPR